MITLSIIGIVTALTIPSLISKNREKETVVRVKKIYSVLSQACSLAVLKNSNIENWEWANDEPANMVIILNNLVPYLNIAKTNKDVLLQAAINVLTAARHLILTPVQI